MEINKKQIQDVHEALNDALVAGKDVLTKEYSSTEQLRGALIDMLLDISTAGDLLGIVARPTVTPVLPEGSRLYIPTIKVVRNTKLQDGGFQLNVATLKTEQIHNLSLRDAKTVVDKLEEANLLSFKRTF